MKVFGGLMCFVGVVFCILGLIFLCMTIDGIITYWGKYMGNEAYGFTTFFGAMAFLFLIASFLLCYFGWKLTNKDKNL